MVQLVLTKLTTES